MNLRRFTTVWLIALSAGLLVGAATGSAAETPTFESRDLNPVPLSLPAVPPIKSKAYALVDLSDSTVLAESGLNQRRAIASLTKIMTALLVVERTKGDDQVEIPDAAVADNEGSAVGLQAGETYTVDQLLDIMLVYSANDAAKALAAHVGGSEEEFIAMMNARAQRLQMDDTRYTSVSGLDTTPLTQSTAADQLALASVALKNSRIARAVALKSVDFERADGSSETYNNRNPLVRNYAGVNGVKTGHTDEAGYCLMASYSGKGGDLLVVVMGAASEQARARDVRALLDYGRAIRPELTLVSGDEPVGTVPVRWTGKKIEIFPSDDVVAHVRVGARLSERIVLPRSIESVTAGDEIGTLTVYADDKEVGSTKLFAASGARRLSTTKRARLVASRWRRAVTLGTREIRRLTNYA